MVKRAILAAIRRYQANGGARHYFGIECNFTPSCSAYTYQAIEQLGVIKGIYTGLKRIGRCTNRDCVEKIPDPFVKERL
ncbi:Putative membrane protein insertion efficiency factor [Saliniradius amylolyticus]|uniref:Membrane protein insertion efficiency factor n=1 Tax=Saliniradius amylolyticus TaxID=2183582 RepID=A0A2S2E0T2_9ALTE|nr:membrane protein insertion efficiency factor YidD [Saliniradius amylolyticus]AWL11142.1 Putative membrane protein insertion efficiency factor [Saliniradius amylolyticus]